MTLKFRFLATSKKKAKHAAAENLINHLSSLEFFKYDLVFLKVTPNSVDETKVSSSTSNVDKHKATVKSEPEINYIGKLLEHCTKNKLPPASFDLIGQTKHADNKSEFHIKCTVNRIEKQGNGFNKQQAKQRAAMEVLQVLMMKPSSQVLDEPPKKRLKTNGESNDAETSSTTCGIIVLPVNIESKGD